MQGNGAQTTDNTTITDFLLARIAEDETLARGCSGGAGNGHQPSWCSSHQAQWGHEPTRQTQRMLSECEAKRRVISGCVGEHNEDWILVALALPYADHPDYRDEWKP